MDLSEIRIDFSESKIPSKTNLNRPETISVSAGISIYLTIAPPPLNKKGGHLLSRSFLTII